MILIVQVSQKLILFTIVCIPSANEDTGGVAGVYKFALYMDGSNADCALHIKGSHAHFAPHMEWRHIGRDQ